MLLNMPCVICMMHKNSQRCTELQVGGTVTALLEVSWNRIRFLRGLLAIHVSRIPHPRYLTHTLGRCLSAIICLCWRLQVSGPLRRVTWPHSTMTGGRDTDTCSGWGVDVVIDIKSEVINIVDLWKVHSLATSPHQDTQFVGTCHLSVLSMLPSPP